MSSVRQYIRNQSLYRKFALAILSLGLIPVFVIFPILAGRTVRGNVTAAELNYRQAASHANRSVETILSSYDSTTKLLYQYNGANTTDNLYYNYGRYDTIRQILTDENLQNRNSGMLLFLHLVGNTDPGILGVHFVADSEQTGRQDYHAVTGSAYFTDEETFLEEVGYGTLDRTSHSLILCHLHEPGYYSTGGQSVITVARNYFDIRGAVGKEKYIGTLYLDIDSDKLESVYRQMNLSEDASWQLLGEDGSGLLAGGNTEDSRQNKTILSYPSEENRYGLTTLLRVPRKTVYAASRSFLLLMVWMTILILGILFFGAFVFSRSLTRPLYRMMDQMKKVENGDFDIHLPVTGHDEIGVLSERFNEMSAQLKMYIDQSYKAKLRQKEAELTALKSQIYPHFLYNTLEIIRMSALETGDGRAAQMIEALSQQIHYLIGPVEDMVPFSTEADIVRKYVYLLNCRIEGKVNLIVSIPEDLKPMIPKLSLQPIVENAYVHGIRPKTGSGNILIQAERKAGILDINVMDNGVGMDGQGLEKIRSLLSGSQSGVKDAYNWQSIGLKNVHDRIRYLYGEEYGIHVTSTLGVGTVVQIRMPYLEEVKPDVPDDTGR